MTLGNERAILAIQQSLLGEVSAPLRAVTVRVSDDDFHLTLITTALLVMMTVRACPA
jgi:hypothetical protein